MFFLVSTHPHTSGSGAHGYRKSGKFFSGVISIIPSHMTVAMECSVLIGYLAGGRFRYSDAKTKVKDSRKQTHNREVLLDVPVLV